MADNREKYANGEHTVLDIQITDIALRLRELLKDICSLRDIIIVRGNIMAAHVHMLVKAPSYLSPSKIAQYLNVVHTLLKEFSDYGREGIFAVRLER